MRPAMDVLPKHLYNQRGPPAPCRNSPLRVFDVHCKGLFGRGLSSPLTAE
jgi:hypothetical protein